MADILDKSSCSVILGLYLFIGIVSCVPEFTILHSPSTLKFNQDVKHIQLSEVPSVLSLTYGFSQNQDLKWKGLQSTNPFKRPKANVLLVVDGFQDTTPSLKLESTAKFALESDTPMLDTERIVEDIYTNFPGQRPMIVDFMSDKTILELKSHHRIFSGLPGTVDQAVKLLQGENSVLNMLNTGSLNSSRNTDKLLLSELQIIQEILTKLSHNKALLTDATPDFYSYVITGYSEIVSTHGEGSQEARDAVEVISQYLQKVSNTFKDLYAGNVAVELVTIPSVRKLLTRKTRSLLEDTTDEGDAKKYNLADAYSDNYSAVFNMILWLMVVLILAIYAVSVAMWNMDPGRDSIIYRMTTTRIKKD